MWVVLMCKIIDIKTRISREEIDQYQTFEPVNPINPLAARLARQARATTDRESCMNYQDNHVIGKYRGPTNDEIRAAMHVRALVSATDSLLELSADQLKAEIDDIELSHARLSKIIQRITNGQA
jgi:hypothetical protein